MSKAEDQDEMRPEYDFSGGVRGKYAGRYSEGANVVVLDPDVAEKFKTSEAVNKALREFAERKQASS
jgi:hypothetical protein